MNRHPLPFALGSCLFLLLCTPVSSSFAETFSWADADGSVHFTDTPPLKSAGKNVAVRKDEKLPLKPKGKIGETFYDGEMLTVTLADRTASSLKFRVRYHFPGDMEQKLRDGLVRLCVQPGDFDLPKGVFSYSRSSIYWPRQLEGEVELTDSTAPESPTPYTTRSIYFYAFLRDRWTKQDSELVKEKVPFVMKWY